MLDKKQHNRLKSGGSRSEKSGAHNYVSIHLPSDNFPLSFNDVFLNFYMPRLFYFLVYSFNIQYIVCMPREMLHQQSSLIITLIK